ncbi:hypothetical protein C6P46_005902 [Rhodotorula mucilaginosa]|uniref:MICOS complex subunit MIC12 n=1 Tax=Rhodotorula mucilaginosa TaxID=5537 RepID=A0A9P6W9C6_RHOMI|nr:hypothetical protein C6P46_005902 [Rhodotorula mucilaginosa]
MSFFYKFMIGAALGGGATLYYQDEIERTTAKLQSDLHRLSDELVRSAPSNAAIQTDSAAQPVIPQRLPFTEELKARWNEQVGSALYAAQTTDWAQVASRTFSKLRNSLSGTGAAETLGTAASTARVESSGSRADEPAGTLTSAGTATPPGANAAAAAAAQKDPIPSSSEVAAKETAASGKRWV